MLQLPKGDSRGRFTYRWTFVNLPESSQLNDSSLQNPMSRNPQFVPDVEGEYDLQFSVKVGDGEPVTDLVKVIATGDNLPPVADAGEAQNTALGEVVKLNGDNTFDPNRDNLTYQWRIVSKPDNSKLTDKDLVGAEFPTQTSILKGANYYFFFSGMMFLSAILFIPVARWYKPQEYLQDEKTEPTT